MENYAALVERLKHITELRVKTIDELHAVKTGENDTFQCTVVTAFMFAYIAFNSSYSVDWEGSLGERRIVEYEYARKNSPTEGKKANKLIDYIFAHPKFLGEEAFTMQVKTHFQHLTKKYQLSAHNREVENLNLRPQLDDKKLSIDFEKIAKKLVDGQQISKDELTTAVKVAYRVRNNIFHAGKSLSPEVQDRLALYAAILITCVDNILQIARDGQ